MIIVEYSTSIPYFEYWIKQLTKDQEEYRKCEHTINSLNLKMTIEHSNQHHLFIVLNHVFSRIEHLIGYKRSCKKCKRMELTLIIFSDYME